MRHSSASQQLPCLHAIHKTQQSITFSFNKLEQQQQKNKKEHKKKALRFSEYMYHQARNDQHSDIIAKCAKHTETSDPVLPEGTTVEQPLKDLLQVLYKPKDPIHDYICEVCHGFRKTIDTSTTIPELPPLWQEHCLDSSQQRYFYNSDTSQVSWTPPPGTNTIACIIFQKTSSVHTLCHCIPSHERRANLLRKFRMYANQCVMKEKQNRTDRLMSFFHVVKSTLEH